MLDIDYKGFEALSENKEERLLAFEKILNSELQNLYEANKDKRDDFLADFLVNEIENMMDHLNEKGFSFGRTDYCGDINYRESTQSWGQTPNSDGNIEFSVIFKGFSAAIDAEEYNYFGSEDGE